MAAIGSLFSASGGLWDGRVIDGAQRRPGNVLVIERAEPIVLRSVTLVGLYRATCGEEHDAIDHSHRT